MLKIDETISSPDGKTCCVRTPLGWSAIGASSAKKRVESGEGVSATTSFIRSDQAIGKEKIQGEWYRAIKFKENAREREEMKTSIPLDFLKGASESSKPSSCGKRNLITKTSKPLDFMEGASESSEPSACKPKDPSEASKDPPPESSTQLSCTLKGWSAIEEHEEEETLKQIESLLRMQWEVDNQGEGKAMSKAVKN